MLRIRLLGGFDLASIGGATAGRPGPKLQCLLAYLAMSRGATVPRGRLVGLLWGERDEERARHSLSQALTTLRSTLGPAATLLQTFPEGVRLERDGLDLDVDAFESAARGQQPAVLQQACELYRGAFLEGIETREPGFEDWLLGERYRLGELAADAFARLLDLQNKAGRTEAAIETARRLVAIAPLHEPAHACLIELYARSGRRGLAESHYARCSELLRRELDQAPGDEIEAALAKARRCSQGGSVRSTRSPHPERIEGRPRSPTGPTAWRASAAVAALLLLLGGMWALRGDTVGNAGGPSYQEAPWDLPARPSIAVLPFENLAADPTKAYFADGITSDVITDLSKFSGLFVIAAQSSSRYGGKAATVQEVARDLGVRYVLKGSVQSSQGRLWIDANLIDATTGRHVWAERYERPAEDLIAVQKDIAQTLARVIGSGWGELQRVELERVRSMPTEDLEAYDLYLRGVAYKKTKTKQNNALARQMFEQAIGKDPHYARAMAESSLTYLNDVFNSWTDAHQESLQKAEELARKAIEVNPSEPWGFVALGLIYQLKAQNERALPLFEKAHALNPNDDFVKEALAFALTYSGSAERGVELLEQSYRMNPYHFDESISLGLAYFFSHRYQDALDVINRKTNRERTPTYWLYKAATHAQLGQLDKARAAVAEALKLDPDLTLQGEHERRLALGLAPAYAEELTAALRNAGLPERPEPSSLPASAR